MLRGDSRHGCQMAIAKGLFGPSGFWTMAPLRYAAKFDPWIAPPRPPPWHNPRKGRDQILPSGNLALYRVAHVWSPRGAFAASIM